MKAIKTVKRRTVQRILKTRGKAEETLVEPDYELAVSRFYKLERDLEKVLYKLKEAKRINERFAYTHASLGLYLAVPLSDPDRRPGDEGAVHDSLLLADCFKKMQKPLVQSCNAVLQKQGIDVLEAVIKQQFPDRKRRIAAHAGLRTDVESYRRRVKSLQERGKEGNDAVLLKFTSKLENAKSDYKREHQALLKDLMNLYHERHGMLEPIYAAYVAAQLELFGDTAGRMHEFTHMSAAAGQLIADAQRNIRTLVAQGGPAVEPPKPREGPISKFWRNSSMTRRGSTSTALSASQGPNLAITTDPPQAPNSATAAFGQYGVADDYTPSSSMASPLTMEHSEIGDGSSKRSAAEGSLQSPYGQFSDATRSPASSAAFSPARLYRGGPNGQSSPSSAFETGADTPASARAAAWNRDAGNLAPESPREGSGGSLAGTTKDASGAAAKSTAVGDATATSAAATDPDTDGSVASPGTGLTAASTVAATADTVPLVADGGDHGHETVVARFRFKGTNEGDLDFNEGDVITVVDKIDDGWWRGELDGRIGLMPVTYLEPVTYYEKDD